VTTPQYGLPAGGPVLEVALPFAIPKSVAADELQHFAALWHDLPRPWILGVIGGGKFPLRLSSQDLQTYGQLLSAKAKSLDGSVIVLDSPRSPSGALQTVAQHLSVPFWQRERGSGPNPYQAALKLCDHLAVTSDSVSMVSEMLQTEKPVWVYRLPRSALAFSWRAERGLPAMLARYGFLHAPRNVDTFISALMEKALIADLRSPEQTVTSTAMTTDHAAVVERIKRLLAVSPAT
jgi:Mitochondrial fission ELM1